MRRGERGQATVELVLLVPLLAAVSIAVFSVLAAGRAREQAASAAHGAAIALIQGRDPRAAARAVLPAGERDRLQVAVTGSRVTAQVRPRVPLLAGLLTATARATAGRRR